MMESSSLAREKLAKNIVYLREKKGISKYRLAEDLYISHSYVAKLEKGIEGNPSMEIIDLLAAYFGVETYELFI